MKVAIPNGYSQQLIDLTMISAADAHYFMVSYSPIDALYYGCAINKTSVAVYYLAQNANNQTLYDLNNAGSFDTIQSIGGDDNCVYPEISNVVIYNVPDTNQLYFSWVEDQLFDNSTQMHLMLMNLWNLYQIVYFLSLPLIASKDRNQKIRWSD